MTQPLGFTFTFTEDKLAKILKGNPRIPDWFAALSKMLPKYEINTIPRVAAFLSQTAHESMNFTALHENLNYKAASLKRVFPKYFPSMALAESYAHNPEKIANKVYGNRMGNGAESTGDGFRYRGRGLIQLTGKNNYSALAESIGVPLVKLPEYLETCEGAVQSACWFWTQRHINAAADQPDQIAVTKLVNGGLIGFPERVELYKKIISILSN